MHLWRNGVIHLLAALASVPLLRRFPLPVTMLSAFACIGGASLLLHDPASASLAPLLYPVGVSLYSVALVAYPSLLLHARSSAVRERQAGTIYAVAGWVGSAMGIGMGQHLHRVPTMFIVLAGVVVAAPLLWRLLRTNTAPALTVLGVALLAGVLQHLSSQRDAGTMMTEPSQVERGRAVYIAEGCIHCHSQYIRPNHAADMTMWGPSRDLAVIRREHPPLIGNRRQGPDLSQVGGRRSPLWLRMHFIDPRAVSFDSIMPSYAYLFEGARGEALVAYVSSLRSPGDGAHLHAMRTWWQPESASRSEGQPGGEQLFAHYCATCHLPSGKARVRWQGAFQRQPPDLLPRNPENSFATDGGLRRGALAQRTMQLARIVKFGVPGTDMPGHEYLPDAEVATLAAWLAPRGTEILP